MLTRRFTMGLCIAAWAAAAAPPAVAQGSADGDRLLAAGDTVGALAAFERAVAEHLDNAEAHYRAGLLYRARTDTSLAVSAARRKAEEHFRYATRFAPDSAKYWLALAEHFRAAGDVTIRIQVPGLLERALEAAREHGSAELADIEYRAAGVDWDRYEQLAHRYLFIGDAIAVDQGVLMGQWRDLETFFASQVKPDPGDPGRNDLRNAEDHLRRAVAANRASVRSAGLLAVALGEDDRWDEAYEVARGVARAVPVAVARGPFSG
jgi:tetratricopeptide (TPR) repeat protein